MTFFNIIFSALQLIKLEQNEDTYLKQKKIEIIRFLLGYLLINIYILYYINLILSGILEMNLQNLF